MVVSGKPEGSGYWGQLDTSLWLEEGTFGFEFWDGVLVLGYLLGMLVGRMLSALCVSLSNGVVGWW